MEDCNKLANTNANNSYNNIIPNSLRSPEELRQMQFNGGIKSGETRRMQADARKILEMKPTVAAQELLDVMVGKGHNMNMSQAIIMVQANKALMQGDTKAAEFVRDTSGNKPTEKVEMKTDLSLSRFTEYFNNFQAIEGCNGEDDEE